MSIDEILAPVECDAFMADTWGQQCRVVQGHADKFAGLASWDELNTWLASDLLLPPRLRLFKDGVPVDAARFMYTRPSGSKTLNPAGLTAALAGGAALSIDLVDRLFPAVRLMVGQVESFFGTSAHANLYAGWRTNNGFGVHWDAQEVFILQVAGDKEWQVYEPTRLHPLAGESPAAPTGEPYWHGTLSQGDMLYLPRGWWHMARPLDEPSLHLTLTVVPPVASDFVAWTSRHLPDEPSLRANLPRPGQPTPPSLVANAASAETMAQFQTDWAAQTRIRPAFDLPAGAQGVDGSLADESSVRLSMSKAVSVRSRSDGTTQIRTGEILATCDAAVVPALLLLSGDNEITIARLLGEIGDASHRRALLVLLTTLVMRGALWVSNEEGSHDER